MRRAARPLFRGPLGVRFRRRAQARCYGCAIPSLGASLSFMRRGEGNTDTRRRWDARLADFVRGLNMALPHAGPAPGLSAAAEPDAERAAE